MLFLPQNTKLKVVSINATRFLPFCSYLCRWELLQVHLWYCIWSERDHLQEVSPDDRWLTSITMFEASERLSCYSVLHFYTLTVWYFCMSGRGSVIFVPNSKALCKDWCLGAWWLEEKHNIYQHWTNPLHSSYSVVHAQISWAGVPCVGSVVTFWYIRV